VGKYSLSWWRWWFKLVDVIGDGLACLRVQRRCKVSHRSIRWLHWVEQEQVDSDKQRSSTSTGLGWRSVEVFLHTLSSKLCQLLSCGCLWHMLRRILSTKSIEKEDKPKLSWTNLLLKWWKGILKLGVRLFFITLSMIHTLSVLNTAQVSSKTTLLKTLFFN